MPSWKNTCSFLTFRNKTALINSIAVKTIQCENNLKKMKIRFCLFEFVASLGEVQYKKRLFQSGGYEDLLIATRSDSKACMQSSFSTVVKSSDWYCIKETVIWSDVGEKLLLITSSIRRQYKLYPLVWVQLLRHLMSCNSQPPYHIFPNDSKMDAEVCDVLIPRYYPLMSKTLNYIFLNRKTFASRGCIFEDGPLCRHHEESLSGTRVIMDAVEHLVAPDVQIAMVRRRNMRMPYHDPIMEDLLQFLIEHLKDGTRLTVGYDGKPHYQKTTVEMIGELLGESVMFGDTQNKSFRSNLSNLLNIIQQDDDHFKIVSKYSRYGGESERIVIHPQDNYHLAKLSFYIEEPLRFKVTCFNGKMAHVKSQIISTVENLERMYHDVQKYNIKAIGFIVEKYLIHKNQSISNWSLIQELKLVINHNMDETSQIAGIGNNRLKKLFKSRQ